MAEAMKPIEITATNKENVTYIFPKSEEIIISRSDLQIQLEKYKERIKSTFSVFDFIALISLWAPVISADFKSIFKLVPIEVRSGYVVMALIISILILFSRFKYFFTKNKISDSAETMANKILEQCQSKPKHG